MALRGRLVGPALLATALPAAGVVALTAAEKLYRRTA